MIINLVVAATENNVIGMDNKLLWHLPKDLAFFKNVTWAMPVIMGRKTYESMGTPLKGRTNIVLTSKKDFNSGNGVITVPSFNEAFKEAANTDAKECYVVGGGEIFREIMPIANRIYMTRVHAYLDGDAFFPEIDRNEWVLTSSMSFKKDEKHAYDFTFETWSRR